MFIKNFLLLFTLLLIGILLPFGLTQPATEAKTNQDNFHNPGFISNPSIYSYTLTNPSFKTNKSSQRASSLKTDSYQQQVDEYEEDNQSENFIDENNFIRFSSNSNGLFGDKNKKRNQATRNFYFTGENEGLKGEGVKDSSGAFSTLSSVAATPTQPAPATGCNVDRLAIYKVVLHTYWTRDLFPKHYPDWRPTAQWTKTLGRTHDSAYALYHLGDQATPGVKQFAETGKTDILDSFLGEQQQLLQQQQASANIFKSSGMSSKQKEQQKQSSLNALQGERSVFDEFNLASITTGAGRSEAKFFVDSNHSLVSLMTRIVPSPDWFIGVDSFELCVGGSWIDTVTVELDPLDAGTDNGFTFTAPNWPTSPQGVIYRITSRYPAHPAGSFFYPKNKRLPPIATFQFIKLKEYELSEVFNFAEDDRKYETVKTQTHLETEHNHVEMNNELSASIERERQNEITPQPTSITEHDKIRSKLLAKMNPMNNGSTLASTPGNGMGASNGVGNGSGVAASAGKLSANIIPKNDKHALMQNIVASYQRAYKNEGSASSASASASTAGSTGSAGYMSKRRRIAGKRQRDCRVSHWSEWSACSKTCGIGEMHRYRKVIKHGKRGGRPCPALQESKWCGSEKACHSASSYFNWSDT